MSVEAVTTRQRVGASVMWLPRATARPRRHSQAEPVTPETRGIVRGIAIGLAVLLLLELHIDTLSVPASVPSEALRALHGWRRR
jgi:hypothetical protein